MKNKTYKDWVNEQKIFEAALTKRDLQKPINGYENRAELFTSKIKAGTQFDLINKKKVILDPLKNSKVMSKLNTDVSTFDAKKDRFIDTNGNSYKLSEFQKTREFGSNKGSGAGSKGTADQESAQCVVLAICYRILNREITSDDISAVNIKKAMKYIDVTASEKDMTNYLYDEWWQKTMIQTANLLMNNARSFKFKFNRGSKIVDKIYSKAKQAMKDAGLRMKDDKWNPADIWMIDEIGVSKINSLSNNLAELNKQMMELFNQGHVIGVSLKKTVSESQKNIKPKISIINSGNEGYVSVYDGFISSPKSKDAYILSGKSKLQLRTKNNADNFSGIISGKVALQGSIGLGPINFIIKDNGLKELPNGKEFRSSVDKYVNELVDLYSKHITPITYNELVKLSKSSRSGNDDWLFSKYYALSIVDRLENANKNTQNEIMNSIMQYAGSKSKYSSIHYKVSE